MTPISAQDILHIVQGTHLRGPLDGQVTGLTTDSRDVHVGDIYVAFTGERVDGHDFVPQAFAQGAAAALVTHPVSSDALGDIPGTVIQVTDSLCAVQALARHERAQFHGPVVAVTGSNGKTTTKEMLAAVFQAQGPCLFTKANHNNELGLPLTILQRTPSHGTIVLEMGMRGFGQIRALCDIARPTAGIITTIGHSHIELLGSQEGIANAKAELLDALPKDGVCVLSADDPWQGKVAGRFAGQPLWYGLDAHRDAFATDIHALPTGTVFTANVLGHQAEVELGTFGLHNVRNALGALLMGAAHGIDLQAMVAKLAQLGTTAGRLHIRDGLAGRKVIDDCYNASPQSMKASIDVLRQIAPAGNAFAVLGDMYELGTYEQEGHTEVGRYAAEAGVDGVIAVGPKAAWIAEGATSAGLKTVAHFPDKSTALKELGSLLPAGAAVLVKASRGMHMEEIVAALVAK